MSGHSNWNNIKRKKEATDAAKAKIFTKIGREITVCVKEGGADPSSNAKLRDLIAKAKSNNVPNDKFGGNLGTSGCVSFLFTEKGMVVLENTGLDEDTVMEDCFAFDADDLSVEDDVVEISCDPSVLPALRDGMTEKGYHVLSAEVEQIPATYTTLTDEDQIKKMNLLLEHLEENDDVQNVYHNWSMPEDIDE